MDLFSSLIALVGTVSVTATAGYGLSVHGRLGIRRVSRDRYVGTPWAWIAYLGGLALVVVALAGLVVGVVVLVW